MPHAHVIPPSEAGNSTWIVLSEPNKGKKGARTIANSHGVRFTHEIIHFGRGTSLGSHFSDPSTLCTFLQTGFKRPPKNRHFFHLLAIQARKMLRLRSFFLKKCLPLKLATCAFSGPTGGGGPGKFCERSWPKLGCPYMELPI